MAVIALDQAKRIAKLEKENKTLRRTCDILNQISDLKDEKIQKAYDDCTERSSKTNEIARKSLSAAGRWNELFHKACVQRDYALDHVPQGCNPDGFTFEDGASMACGKECGYTENMVRFWARGYKVLMFALLEVEPSGLTPDAIDCISEATRECERLYELYELDGLVSLHTGERHETSRDVKGDEPRREEV